jgi:RND family efflux transporter MFP subunit
MPDLDLPVSNSSNLRRAALIGGAVLALILVAGGTARVLDARALAADTQAMATPSVTLIQPRRGVGAGLSLPGRLEAWNEAPVFARTSGYIRSWRADIGARVRTGQILAEIDAPEVDQQLAAAEAALGVTQAQLDLSQTTADRWRRLLEVGTVSQQAADERAGAYAANRAARDQAVAEVRRLRALTGFKSVIAPFDGVVTTRSADIGGLVTAGSSTAGPLFTIADDRRLRLYVSIPESQAALFRPGGTARFTVPDQPGRDYSAVIVASAGAVDRSMGAMTLQLSVDNADGSLRPGGFARVAFAADDGSSELRIPASALLFRQEGAAVAVISADHRVTIRPIAIARDDGRELAIASGLTGGERIIDNPSSAITGGQTVRIAPPQSQIQDSRP